MKNTGRFAKMFLAFVMAFGLIGGFGPMPLAAQSVSVGSESVHVDVGFAEVPFFVTVAAGTTVQHAWVSGFEGASAIVSDQTQLQGRTFEEAETVTIMVAVAVDEEHRGGTLTGQVIVDYVGGSAVGFLTVHVAVPEPTPGPTPRPVQPQTPVIVMSAPVNHIEMTPGVSTIVNVTLQNASNFHARNFHIVPRADADFTVEIVGQLPAFSVLANASRTFSMRITPHSRLETGTHTITFDYTFENNVREVTTQQGNIIVRVYRPVPGEPRVMITDFVMEEMTVNAGDDFTVRAGLRNTSTTAVSNVQLSVGGFAEGGLVSRG
ncbi:MAG: hypothetical protein LBE55_07090, partial [Clostridiales bacterium]|nr:hypothetical protein [Clostridiales bacterium]